MALLKPPKLERGDTIAIIAPSSSLAKIFPHRVEQAIAALKHLGFNVKKFPTVGKDIHGKAGSIAERVDDIHHAFEDEGCDAILCAIGGICSNELLNHLDYHLISRHPKIFCGYSDITLLHMAIHSKSKLITFYGPSVMNQFGENRQPLDYTSKFFLKALTEIAPLGTIPPSEKWTDEVLDWSSLQFRNRQRKLNQNKGYSWLRGGKSSGDIIGGCLPSLLQLNGTEYAPNYRNKILFVETPEGQDFSKGIPPPYAESHLVDLRNTGVFDNLRGLIVGRPFGYTDEQKEEFKRIVIEAVGDYDFPVLMNADIGHTDPMITLPLGVKVTLDSEKNLFSVEESGVL